MKHFVNRKSTGMWIIGAIIISDPSPPFLWALLFTFKQVPNWRQLNEWLTHLLPDGSWWEQTWEGEYKITILLTCVPAFQPSGERAASWDAASTLHVPLPSAWVHGSLDLWDLL